MVFNCLLALSVAHLSTDAWQQMACIPFQDRLSSRQLFDLVCCVPLQQLGRFTLWFWTFLCLPPADSFFPFTYYYPSDDEYDNPHLDDPPSSSSSSSSSAAAVDLDDYYYDFHSD